MSILNDYITKNLIFLDVEITEQKELLEYMAKCLHESGNVNEIFIKEVVNREQKFPTGLQIEDIGVAIPHSDIEHVNNPAVAMAVLKEPVGFYSMENSEKIVAVNI